ncbi:uncharacterized protein [Euphorbia lathyris]|uniref:uncharacterized protein n=1 Tax=Euphorbia lathyris TaxID=212925 RepID=UPI003313A500
MEELLNTEMANVSLIHMYILFLNEEYKLEKFDIKFLCPHSISDNECQRRPNEVTKYINDVFFFEARKKKKLSKYILAPYLEDGHWILFVIDLSKGYLYMFDSLIRAEDLSPRRLTVASMMKSSYNVYKGSKGAKQCNKDLIIKPVQCAQQSGSTECGYYVMRYMFEIVTSHRECNIDLNEAYSIRKKPYIEELLEVREQCERFFIKNCMDGRESKESLSNKANVGGSSSLKEKNVDGSDSTQSLSKKDNVRGPSISKENVMDEIDSTQSLSNEDNVRGPSSLTEYIMDRKDSTKSLSKVDIIGAPSSIQEKTTDGKNSIESLSKNDTDEGRLQ